MTDMVLRPDPETNRPGRTCRWYDNATFPFGFGEHYTTFSTALSKPKTASFDIADLVAQCDGGKHLDLCPVQPSGRDKGFSVRVANTGKVESDVVLLAFIVGEFGPLSYPLKTLVAYTHVQDLKGGKEEEEEEVVELSIKLGGLARHDTNDNQVLYPGKYRLLLDEPSQVAWEFELVDAEVVMDHWPQPESWAGVRGHDEL